MWLVALAVGVGGDSSLKSVWFVCGQAGRLPAREDARAPEV